MVFYCAPEKSCDMALVVYHFESVGTCLLRLKEAYVTFVPAPVPVRQGFKKRPTTEDRHLQGDGSEVLVAIEPNKIWRPSLEDSPVITDGDEEERTTVLQTSPTSHDARYARDRHRLREVYHRSPSSPNHLSNENNFGMRELTSPMVGVALEEAGG
ncbi:hypothetical protein AAG570_004280 [Ranatra chinensis]|uniref:Uncharacterized protein n=1 Tax=Ranatra chinensis TaxID=642074 RepID=A0ABD0Y187_9HEMI